MIQGTFDEETYKRKSDDIKDAILITQMSPYDAKVEINNIEECLLYSKHFLSNLADLWLAADHNLMQRMQILIFPERTYCENKVI